MQEIESGMTDIYKQCNNGDVASSSIRKLRTVYPELDQAAFSAYGWSDISASYEHRPDFVEADNEGNEIEKYVRYCWENDIRDEVLARLLTLHAERAKEEQLSGQAKAGAKKKGRRGKARSKTPDNQPDLFES